MPTITPDLLEQCYGRPQKGVSFDLWAPYLDEAATAYELTTAQRLGMFLAQVGHESGRLRFVRELWGPTSQQRKYEPGGSLAAQLGNMKPGDGFRYRGHGLIQVTGAANHRAMTQALRRRHPELKVPDFEADPDALCMPLWASLSAGEYWALHDLNHWADLGDFTKVTRKINGGTNGLADRQVIYSRALPACLLAGV